MTKSRRVEEAERELRNLNIAFQSGSIKLPWFAEVLSRIGYQRSDVMIVEVTPDSEGSFFGLAFTQDDRFLEFDLDADDPSFSVITDETVSINNRIRAKLRHKPWSPERVAIRLKKEIIQKNSL